MRLDRLKNHKEVTSAGRIERQTGSIVLRDLSPDEAEALRTRIERLQGHIRFIMHPLYYEKGTKPDYRNELRHFEKSIQNAYNETASSPVFVCEGVTELPATKRRIAGSLETSEENLATRGIVLIPTIDDEGIPHETAFTDRGPDSLAQERWDALAQAFKQLGVRSITASGMYIRYDHHQDAKLDLCLGSAVQALRDRGFLVDISSGIVHDKESLRRSGAEVKQTGKTHGDNMGDIPQA